MNLFEKIRKDVVLSAIVYLVLGLILFFRPGTALVTIVDILAIMLAIMGVVSLVTYFARKDAVADGGLVKGVLYLVLAAVIHFGAGFIISIIPFIMGVLVIISGIVKLQKAMDLMKIKANGYVPILVISILSLVLGLIILLNPFATAALLFRIIGFALIYNAVSDLLTVFYFSKKTRY